jgi:hypothetical protein
MVRGQDQVGELSRRVLVTAENQRAIRKFVAGRDATLDIAVPERASLRIDLRILGHDLGVDPTAQFIGRSRRCSSCANVVFPAPKAPLIQIIITATPIV